MQAGQRIKIPPFDSSCGNGEWDVRCLDCMATGTAFRTCSLGLVANRTVPSKHAGVLSSAPTTGVFDCRAYRVKTGDSLSAIAYMFQITVRNHEWCRLAVCCAA